MSDVKSNDGSSEIPMAMTWDRVASLMLTEEELDIIDQVTLIVTTAINRRCELKLTQHELADLTGLKQPAIARFECMNTMPQIDTLYKITKALGLKIVLQEVEKPVFYGPSEGDKEQQEARTRRVGNYGKGPVEQCLPIIKQQVKRSDTYYANEKLEELVDGDGYTMLVPIGTEYTRCSECNTLLFGSDDVQRHNCWKGL